jgi:hypothetical protein
VCDATFDTSADKFVVQGDLKRYNSLADSPIADMAVMIRTHFQGTLHHDQHNDLGILRAGTYYREIDISTGYARHEQLWVAIPKHGQ